MAGLLYCLPLTSNWLQTKKPENQTVLTQELQKLNQNTSPLVLLGDEYSGKTLLLFQAAVSYASQDYHVTFISRRPLSQMPLPVHGMTRPETAGLLKTLTFLYMGSVGDVINYCSSMHTRTLLPDVLIVDDLEYYLGLLTEPSLEVGCAHLCAILCDTMAFISKKGGHGILVIGCRNKQTFLQSVFTQFRFGIANISSVCSTSDQERMYQLCLQTGKSSSLTLKYNIQNIGLFLNDLSMSIPDT